MDRLTPDQLLATLHTLPASRRYWLAYSGGVDSHVLLHLLSQLQQSNSLSQCAVVHVHHGLSPHADLWVEHCQTVCDGLSLPLTVLRVDAKPTAGESPEAKARDARYEAIATLMEEGDCLLTAHHQEDQAETLMLQLLRGAGPKGLAAMPAWQPFAGGIHARPLLSCSRRQLVGYAEQAGLQWVDDESNSETRFDRNYLRHEVMPLLQQRWPATARVLARSASHHAEAATILDEVAAEDLLQVAQGEELLISELAQLSTARQKNLLRHWIQQRQLPQPDSRHLQHILGDVLDAAEDAVPLVCWSGAELRRFAGRLFVMSPLPEIETAQTQIWDGESGFELAGQQWLTEKGAGQGLALEQLHGGALEFRLRQGGEKIRPVGRQGRHALKKLFQERGIVPWQRDRLPLLYRNGELIAVADLWIAEGYQAEIGQSGLSLRLQPAGGKK